MSSEEKPVGFHDKPMSIWQRLPHRSDTGGVSPMMIETLEKYTNERMRGMTPESRARRKQWLEDQKLSPREPVEIPEIYVQLNNPIRRFFNWPYRKIELMLKPRVGPGCAEIVKMSVKTIVYGIMFGYAATYIGMFHNHTWEKFRGGLRIVMNKPQIYPGDPNYPFVSTLKEDDYASDGFKDSKFYKSEEQIRAEEAKRSKIY